MSQVKIDEDLHTYLKNKSVNEGVLLEKIIDDIIRPWVEYDQKKEGN